MSAERAKIDPARLAELFQHAVTLAPESRAEYLAHECGADAVLRARLEELLASDAAPTDGRFSGRAPARKLGKYTLLEVLGEGGMGTVWLARSDEPARLVALKTVRVGTGSPEFAARLVTELRALATLDHPAIARVLDAGTSESSLPWFALEFVPGRPITEHCERAGLDLAGRIALFRELCAAVQHAHQRGLVHRDIKPGNVLVHERDGVAHVKLIDFGVLFAEDGAQASETLAGTDLGVVGTLAHMSPEQAEPRKYGLDTQSDVYALGVLLYELLAGVPPHDPAALAGLPRALALLRILNEPAPAASARVAALAPAQAERIAAARGLTPSALVRALAGDLDLVLAKALAKERSRRYASAAELAADLARYLADEPLAAGSPGGARRLAKFVRRHRAAVLTLTTLAVLGAGALVATTLAWRRARSEHAKAERELVESRYQYEKAQAFLEFVEYAFTLADPGPDGRDEPGVRELLRRTTGEVSALFADRPGAEAAVHHSLGHFFLLLGDDELALEQLLDARRIRARILPADHPDLFATLTRQVQAARRLGRRDAQALADEALAMARRLYAAHHPELSAEVERVLAGATGRPAELEAEVAAIEALLAALEGDTRPQAGELLARLLIEAGLRSTSGAEYFTRLERVAGERLGPSSLRHLVLQWKLANLCLLPDQREYALALRFARELAERAGAFLARDHWLVLDAARVEGLALAGLWTSSREPALVAQAEAALWRACDVPRRADAAPGTREAELERGFAQLVAMLDDEPTRLAWLEQSWPQWLAARRGTPTNHTWWPATRREVGDPVRRLALALLAREQTPDAAAHVAFALFRLGRATEALEALEPAPEDPDGLRQWLRVLALHELGREEEAATSLAHLRESTWVAPCELARLREELVPGVPR